jgi:hypothetical protein
MLPAREEEFSQKKSSTRTLVLVWFLEYLNYEFQAAPLKSKVAPELARISICSIRGYDICGTEEIGGPVIYSVQILEYIAHTNCAYTHEYLYSTPEEDMGYINTHLPCGQGAGSPEITISLYILNSNQTKKPYT